MASVGIGTLLLGICCVEGPEKEWDSCRYVERSKAELLWGSFFRNAWLWVSQRSSRISSYDFTVGWVSPRFFRNLPLPLAVCAGAAESGGQSRALLVQLPNRTSRPSHPGCPSGLGVALPGGSSSSEVEKKLRTKNLGGGERFPWAAAMEPQPLTCYIWTLSFCPRETPVVLLEPEVVLALLTRTRKTHLLIT